MNTFLLTSAAKSDLKKIAIYNERRWGYSQRNLYLRQFDQSFHAMAENPLTGMNCDFIKKGFRKFPQGSHIIFYRITDENRILIVRILHKQMDIKSKF